MSTSRRGFLRGLAGVGAGAAATGLAGCAPDISPAPFADVEKDASGNVSLEVARYPDLSRDGGAITLRVKGDVQQVLVMHPGGGEYAAVSNICTHSGCPLGFQEGEAICPCHLSRFALDGKVTHPPARAPLKSYPAYFDTQTGLLRVELTGGDPNFPSVIGGKAVLSFSQFPELRTPGNSVKGTPGGYGKPIMVIALADGTYSAVDALCTHLQCEVDYQSPTNDLLCPCHHSRFAVTGEVTRGPDPSGAITISPLRKFTATSDASGVTVSFT